VALLEVSDLCTSFFLKTGELKVLDGISFDVDAGEIVGLVGESGSGKSVTAYSIARLLKPPGRVVSGSVSMRGRDLTSLGDRIFDDEYRGREIAMIFQSTREALDPVRTVGAQLTRVLRLRRGLSRSAAAAEAVELLREVRIADPERRMHAHPHELSGGMAQRVMIALALSCRPSLLIADELTTALDVTTQFQITTLLRKLRETTGASILLITHDLPLAAELCDRIVVMYAGRIAESDRTDAIFDRPNHPYSAALLGSRPKIGTRGRIPEIAGEIASLGAPPSGCRFHPRCANATRVCAEERPGFTAIRSLGNNGYFCHHPIRPEASLTEKAAS
jgi:oligopeptide/dipeptide ABC transporter ATP-binding protein